MPMPERDDEQEWIRKCVEGDGEAYEQLVMRYQRMIHALTYRMTGSLSDSEDLAQETFIRAFRQIGSFRGDASFSSWLYRIAINTCLNWKKAGQRREVMHQELTASENEPATDHVLAERVQEALLALNPKQRAAIVLTTYDGLNHAEAARVLGCSETTVSWHIFMARKKLKEILGTTE